MQFSAKILPNNRSFPSLWNPGSATALVSLFCSNFSHVSHGNMAMRVPGTRRWQSRKSFNNRILHIWRFIAHFYQNPTTNSWCDAQNSINKYLLEICSRVLLRIRVSASMSEGKVRPGQWLFAARFINGSADHNNNPCLMNLRCECTKIVHAIVILKMNRRCKRTLTVVFAAGRAGREWEEEAGAVEVRALQEG